DLLERSKYLKSLPQTIIESAGPAAAADDDEYRRRSPVTYVDKLTKPLLIHAATNDETVRIVEVQKLIDALQAAGKKFEHKVYYFLAGNEREISKKGPLALASERRAA